MTQSTMIPDTTIGIDLGDKVSVHGVKSTSATPSGWFATTTGPRAAPISLDEVGLRRAVQHRMSDVDDVLRDVPSLLPQRG